MSRGGKRDGSGRKKIGNLINIRIDESILVQIDETVVGNTRAEKIRKCIKKGLENYIDGGTKNE